MYKNFLILGGLLFALGCSENFGDNPHPNQPPETFISIFSDNQLNETISQKTFNWWGDDPDGIVTGFIYSFAENPENVMVWDTAGSSNADWTFTTETQKTFNLRLTGRDTTYTLQVKAVDNHGAADPTAAVQKFPIINTRPVVEFLVGTDVPDTTFTVASFNWSGVDLDGDDTIAKFQYVLDDSSSTADWHDLSPTLKSVTITAEDGLTEGEHVFFLRAVDIAGAESEIIRMPRNDSDTWFVREPTSSFLIVDDYNIADNSDSFYKSSLQAIVGPVNVWDIKSNNRALEPPSSQAFTQTLLLFDRIFWYADTEPNLEKAQVALPEFINQGGRVIMTTSFMEFATNLGDPLDFSPADSLGAKISRITRDQLVTPVEPFTGMGFPDLKVNTAIIPNVFPVVPKISSKAMYMLPEKPGSWPGTPSMGVIDRNSTFVFFGLPLAKLDGSATVRQLLEKILNEVF